MQIIMADYTDHQHCNDIMFLLNEYAKGPMGGGKALPDNTLKNLPKALAKRHDALSILCYVDNKAVALVNGFEGFSTFACQPLMNIHDIIVLPSHRGLGISQRLLSTVETIAIERGYCKITLEVLEGNHIAHNAYVKYGFAGYALDPAMGTALFLEKHLSRDFSN